MAMIVPGGVHTVMPGEGRSVDLGVVNVRALAAGDHTGKAFTLAEFFGTRDDSIPVEL